MSERGLEDGQRELSPQHAGAQGTESRAAKAQAAANAQFGPVLLLLDLYDVIEGISERQCEIKKDYYELSLVQRCPYRIRIWTEQGRCIKHVLFPHGV